MRNFKNSHRKNKYRNGSDRGYVRNTSNQKINGDFLHNEIFRRKNPGKNNHNASKLIEKYNNLAREALSSGDKILSENYFQHADHFTRILNEQETYKKQRFYNNTIEEKNKVKNEVVDLDNKKVESEEVSTDTKIVISNN